MIAKEGLVILIPLILTTVAGTVGQFFYPLVYLKWVNMLLIGLTIFSVYFFRLPYRELPIDSDLFISPADGKVVEIKSINDPDLGEMKQISIFLSVFNVHAQWVPFDAKVKSLKYNHGKFSPAFKHKSSLDNEQMWVIFDNGENTYKIKQIAGLIARRIINYMEPEMVVKRGDRLGFIRFGSRVDIIVPNNFDMRISVGDKVNAVETIIGEFI